MMEAGGAMKSDREIISALNEVINFQLLHDLLTPEECARLSNLFQINRTFLAGRPYECFHLLEFNGVGYTAVDCSPEKSHV